jgi:hypothetical protein
MQSKLPPKTHQKLPFWYRLFNLHFKITTESEYAEMRADVDGEPDEWTEERIRQYIVLCCHSCNTELETALDIVPLPGSGVYQAKAKGFCSRCQNEVVNEYRFMRGTLWIRHDEQWVTLLQCPPLWKFWRYF